jgi:hypothetical protein
VKQLSVLAVVAILGGVAACGPTKQDWMTKFEAGLTDRMCGPDFIFVHCYEIDQAACRTLVAPIAHTCTAKIADQLPDHMDEELGRKYGAIAGQCVGDEVGTRLETKIRQPIDAKCQDPSAWH